MSVSNSQPSIPKAKTQHLDHLELLQEKDDNFCNLVGEVWFSYTFKAFWHTKSSSSSQSREAALEQIVVVVVVDKRN